ncbi:hypothetical protein [Kordiimonas gwangyangensis]|nr:hypothetical protein [Kordiimonas gwangyangensis]
MADNRTTDNAKETDDPLARRLADHHARHFAPGFADRVMARVREDALANAPVPGGINLIAVTMAVMFRRMAVPAVALCFLLAAYNVTVSQTSAYGPPDDLIDAIFALVPTGADAALSL